MASDEDFRFICESCSWSSTLCCLCTCEWKDTCISAHSYHFFRFASDQTRKKCITTQPCQNDAAKEARKLDAQTKRAVHHRATRINNRRFRVFVVSTQLAGAAKKTRKQENKEMRTSACSVLCMFSVFSRFLRRSWTHHGGQDTFCMHRWLLSSSLFCYLSSHRIALDSVHVLLQKLGSVLSAVSFLKCAGGWRWKGRGGAVVAGWLLGQTYVVVLLNFLACLQVVPFILLCCRSCSYIYIFWPRYQASWMNCAFLFHRLCFLVTDFDFPVLWCTFGCMIPTSDDHCWGGRCKQRRAWLRRTEHIWNMPKPCSLFRPAYSPWWHFACRECDKICTHRSLRSW